MYYWFIWYTVHIIIITAGLIQFIDTINYSTVFWLHLGRETYIDFNFPMFIGRKNWHKLMKSQPCVKWVAYIPPTSIVGFHCVCNWVPWLIKMDLSMVQQRNYGHNIFSNVRLKVLWHESCHVLHMKMNVSKLMAI